MVLRNVYFAAFLLLSLASSAQRSDTAFEKEWLGIDTLIVKNDLTRTALQKLNILYQKAKQRQLQDQMIKILIYRYSLEDRIITNDENHIITSIKTEIVSSTDETQKAILYSLLAKQYKRYYDNHRWNLYNRTRTEGLAKDDITTWNNEDFLSAISQNFLRSIRNSAVLKQKNIRSYDAIVIKGNGRDLRPTVYDLLAHEALDYFKSGEAYRTKPTDLFTITQVQALEPMDDFIKARFTTGDSSSLQWRALELFRLLISFHRNDADKNSLLAVDLERIEWVYQHSVFTGKETVYQKTLQSVIGQYPAVPQAATGWYLLAQQEMNRGATYAPFGDTTGRYGYVKAKQLIEKALPLFKEPNMGTANMQNLLVQINVKQLRTQTEQVNVPGNPLRALVTFRNIDTLFGRIIRIDNNDTIRNNNGNDTYWKTVRRLPALRNFTQVLPHNDDMQPHSTEIKIDGLPVGEYALLSSNGKDFSDGENKMCIQFFYVSNISYLRNKNDFFVLNRESGKPMANVKVTILRPQYSSRLRKTVYDTAATRSSNSNGYFRFESNNNNGNNFRYQFVTAADRLSMQENEYSYYENEEAAGEHDAFGNRVETTGNRVFFFTDRSIYRPGQTVFFKGIAVARDRYTKLSKLIVSKDSGLVYLRDVNSKIIDSVRFGLNDYGSFTGRFRLPQNPLPGNFSIEVNKYNRSAISFSVEEYKRPKFSAGFDKVKGSYRLNDTIVITGIAKSYAGNAINGAKVSYNITRNSRYRPWFGRRPYMSVPNREIAHGEVTTDAEGKFTIRFKALADDITDRTGNPTFDFAIHADITDGGGETHGSDTHVTVGFSSLLLQVNALPVNNTDSIQNINILTTNLSNEKEPSTVHIKIFSLVPPGRPVRKRYWERPDQFVMNEKEFISHFPTDEYREETDFQTWATSRQVIEGDIDTKDTNQFTIAPRALEAGAYRVEAVTTDKYGVEVKQVIFIQVFDRKNNQLPVTAYQFNYIIKNIVEPGQTAAFITGSVADNRFVISRTEKPRQKKSNIYDFSYRNAGLQSIQYTADETDRGGVNIDEAYVYDNRIYTNEFRIMVPWTNKVLQVSYASYRDKTEPGSAEKWTVTVQGEKGEKAAAELLTGMYDASLDMFRPHDWYAPGIWEYNTGSNPFSGYTNFSAANNAIENYLPEKYAQHETIEFDHLATDGQELWSRHLLKWLNASTIHLSVALKEALGQLTDFEAAGYGGQKDMSSNSIQIRGKAGMNQTALLSKVAAGAVEVAANSAPSVSRDAEIRSSETKAEKNTETINPVIRKNFNETAFFFPQLYADSTGKYSFTFTIPEALTQWKWMSLAHTKDLAFGTKSVSIITQKKLMVQPNAPRFLREGDNMEFSTKVVNLTDKEIKGQVTLELIDANTNTSVDGWFQNVFPAQYFTVEVGQSMAVKFPIQIPFSFNRPLTWRIVAKAGEYSDGEENTLAVLTNRTLVTESLPLFLANDTTKNFRFEKLLTTTSESLTHESITVEYTSNPIWYAVQALPYLMEYPYECAEQTFNKFYANALASYIVNKHPRIKQLLDSWRTDTAALKSNLRKNEELKQLLLQETPWVLQAESEEQQKKNLALLFDLVKLGSQADAELEKLRQAQLPNGSFSWFKGGYEDRYITNYILTGIGKLKRLGALTPDLALRMRTVLVNAIKYMDGKFADDYNWLVKNKVDLSKQPISTAHIDYLYMRSFFADIAQQSPEAYKYFFNQGKQFWNSQNSYYKAQLGLIYYRSKDEKFATAIILPSLLENVSTDSKLGMFWKSAYTGAWYQSPIEHQSMMIAFMSEINNNDNHTRNINAMKTWLLLNKQTNNWRTTIATADACYALLLNGSDWLSTDKKVTIKLGSYTVSSSSEKTEAGTGYLKKRFDGKLVKPEMGNITVTTKSEIRSINKAGDQPSWGSIYWQYYEDLDKITSASTPLSLNKKLFIERNTDKGKVLSLIKEGDELKIGDKVVVRMELRSDRDMDYLHLKDMRAASMEPVNVISSYKWQDGLGYYESTRDASTNFFISHLSKGTYVFEYPLFITHSGIFSVGIATIQCMYAPEFTSHSEGLKIRVATH